MRHKRTLLLAALSLASGSALSQTPGAQSANGSPHPVRRVQRQSYTVELKTTTVQTLANGATISRQSTDTRAEDSQHRIFLSMTLPFPDGVNSKPITMGSISDPVQGIEITWRSEYQEATVLKLPPPDQRYGCWQSDSGNARRNYGPPRPLSGDGGGASATQSSSVVTAEISSVGDRRGLGSIGAVAGTVPKRAEVEIKTEGLGAATIEGVEVQGIRMTRTIPVGQIGNDQPLVGVTDSWTAPSLGFSLRTVRDDPQSGKSTTEVVRLDLSEPPLSTFQPPDGYKVIVEEMHQVACQEPGRP